ncbi:MAG: hypothetical protein F4086_05070 [Gemmatimonadetes bacterium]|nr:hypothetical protein [Gemmatimonadota bacterium]
MNTSWHRQPPDTLLLRSGRALAAAALGALWAAAPAAAHTLHTVTLVSNIANTGTGTLALTSYDVAQAFTTGNKAPTATISARTSPVTEGVAAEFTVTLSSAAPAGGVTVNLTVSDAAGSDFVASGDEGSRTVMVAEGNTSAAYSVATVGDSNYEPDGSVTVELATGAGYTLGTMTSASVMVQDDDETWSATLAVGEFDGRPPRKGYSYSDSIGSLTDSTFAYGSSHGRWDDIVLRRNGRFVMSGVRTSGPKVSDSFKVCVDGTPFHFNPLGNDDLDEVQYWMTPYTNLAWTNGQTVKLKLIEAAHSCGPAASVSLSASPNPVAEGSPVTVTASLSATLSSQVAIPVRVTRGTAEADDIGSLTSIVITPGSITGTGQITTTDDTDTDDETFTVALGSTLPSTVTTGSPNSVTVTITDGDVPTVSLSASPNPVAEGSPVTVTATLSGTLGSNVTIPLTLTAGTAETDDYGSLAGIEITAGSTSATGRITTTDDADTDDETFTVALGTLPASVTAGSPNSVTVTITDGDVPTVSLSASPNPVAEGSPVTVTATLSGTLGTNVTIPLTLTAGTAETDDYGLLASIEISAGAITGTGQITTTDDEDTDDETFTVALGSTLPSQVTAGSPNSVTVTITDGDVPAPPASPTVSLSASPNPVAEGSPVTVTATLSGTLGTNVTIPLTLTAGTAETDDYGLLASIEISAGATAGTGRITTTDDADTDDETFTVALGSTLPFQVTAGSPDSVTVTITDGDDIPPPASPPVAVEVWPLTVKVSEAGGTTTYTVVLQTEPPGDVTVTPSSSAPDNATVSGALTFTPSNWDELHTVTITGVDDDVDNPDGRRKATIRHAVTGGGYDGVEVPNVSVSVTDDDVAGITIDLDSVTVDEDGGEAAYTVVLATEPTGAVTVTPSSSVPENAAVDDVLTFTPSNWDRPQLVTVTGVNDAIDNDGDRTATVSHAIAGGGYDGVAAADVSVKVTDDDVAGITIDPDSVTVAENGGQDTYTVVLATEPTGTVTVTPLSSAPDAATAGGVVTFTPSNWRDAQTVTVTGVNDDIDNAEDRTATISHTVSGGGYDALPTADVPVTVTDDDMAGITIAPDSVTVAEDGGEATYTVVLDTEPRGAVTVTPLSSAPDAAAAGGALTFTPSNWRDAQTVTVTGVSDDVDNANDFRATTVSHTVLGGGYGNVKAPRVAVAVTDDDVAGITISETALSVAEGEKATFTVRLDTEPAFGVTIGVKSGEPTEAIARPARLVFDAANWDRPQTVTVTSVDDDVDDRDRTFDVTLAAALTADDRYRALEDGVVRVTTRDDDTAGMTVGPVQGQVTESGGTASFTIVLHSQPTGAVTVPVTSGDPGEAMVSRTGVEFTPTHWSTPQTVTITGVDDGEADGPQTVEVTVGRPVSPDGKYASLAGQAMQVRVADDGQRTQRPVILRRSLAAFARSVGTETVEALGSRLGEGGSSGAFGGGPQSGSHMVIGGRQLSCAGAGSSITGCVAGDLWRNANRVLGLRLSLPAEFAALGGALNGLASGRGAAAFDGMASRLGALFRARAVADGRGTADPAASDAAGHSGAPGTATAESRPRGLSVGIDANPLWRAGDLLSRSSFEFSAGGDGPDGAGTGVGAWTFWGRGAAGGFESRGGGPDGEISLDGSIRAAYLGADYRLGSESLVGVALSRHNTTIDFGSDRNGTGSVEAGLTNLFPYASWSPRRGTKLWGVLGGGLGSADMTEEVGSRAFATDLTMGMAALGVRQEMTGWWALRADAFAVRIRSAAGNEVAGLTADVRRVRLAPEVTRRTSSTEGVTLASRFDLGVRYDGGHAETGIGAEAGAELGLSHPGSGLSVEARGRTLLVHQAEGFHDWGAAVTLRMRPGGEDGGLSLSVSPEWGGATGTTGGVWRGAGLMGAVPDSGERGGPAALSGQHGSGGRLAVHAGYALPLAERGRIEPYGRWTRDGPSGYRLDVGTRLSVLDGVGPAEGPARGLAVSVDLFGEQYASGLHPVQRRLALQGSLRFR